MVKRVPVCISAMCWLIAIGPAMADDQPVSRDPRLSIELVAADPDIVHPIAVAFDARGRLLVIESHTHFAPEGYQGPKHDRVRVLEDTAGDGKADRFTTFYEGTTAAMDLAAHPDGSIYLATRSEILRLRDTTGDGRADEARRIAFLDTPGNYPHNGLCGLAFDSAGDLYFGLGENLGAPYKLEASDGSAIRGGGEGGNIFWCTADGQRLRRVATGFWNPFGVEIDIFGRIFSADNDPDGAPPCRLVHVVEGGDYGFQFRYGRSGRHPFQSWFGQLPGTLPMMSGTGEAPCAIISYESDGLPAEYRGELLVASWAEHCLERYSVAERGASWAAERRIVIEGGSDFRPVGIALAPDGSLYLSDWVLRDYKLHGRGRIWHVRQRDAQPQPRPAVARDALASPHRPLRERAARQLAATAEGRGELRKRLGDENVRVRAAALAALVDAGDEQIDLAAIANADAEIPLRAMAARAMVRRGIDASGLIDDPHPAVFAEIVRGLPPESDPRVLLLLATSEDSFLRQAAIQNLSGRAELLDGLVAQPPGDPRARVAVLLALRAGGDEHARRHLPKLLADGDADVRFLAAKWIADEDLKQHRPLIAAALEQQPLGAKLFFAFSAALARLDGRGPDDRQIADQLVSWLGSADRSPAQQVMALRLVPPNHPQLKLEQLAQLAAAQDAELQLEAVRSLAEHPSPDRFALLVEIADDSGRAAPVRAAAVAALAGQAERHIDRLLAWAEAEDALADEALRSLTGLALQVEQRSQLMRIAGQRPDAAPLVARALGQPPPADRPPRGAIDAWLARLSGSASAQAGQRVFHSKVAGCARCHRVEGRGSDVGPDLSGIGRVGRKAILQSILEPSREVAPYFQVWAVTTDDGLTRSGLLVRTHLDEQGYLDSQGNVFHVSTPQIIDRKPLETSLMPDGLVDQLTDQELRDLLAYLAQQVD